ncbi:DNA primase [Candidatus Woesearchaeota archaeon]|nr:DNA primase [Candidatus Woesearchaeota archaeon]
MGKISPVSAKYIIHASIDIEGVVDRPDVIGAVFGQTEGLLGSELELRELQRSGRIGRIEVETETRSGKTKGSIVIPSSLDKAETAIVGAALEIIQRIGPCNAKIHVQNIEDVRVSKRRYVIDRAKELLKQLMDTVMPDSQELSDEVAYSVRVMEIKEYGKARLPAGPNIEDSDEIIVVEGRADVLNLLKHGIKNAVAINGTSIPPEIIELANKKIVTVFVDGDRGGKLILQELMGLTEIDFVCMAQQGKEVEELTKKEIHKSLRGKVSAEQAKLEFNLQTPEPESERKKILIKSTKEIKPTIKKPISKTIPVNVPEIKQVKKKSLDDNEKKKFNSMLESLIGTRGAYILDEKLNILGKVPVSELLSTIKSLSSGVYAIVFDGIIEKDLLSVCEKSNINFLVGMSSKVGDSPQLTILTADDF